MSYCEEMSWIRNRLKLYWIAGHSNVEGNQQANQLERLGTKIGRVDVANATLPQIKLLKDTIDEIIREQNDEKWRKRDIRFNS